MRRRHLRYVLTLLGVALVLGIDVYSGSWASKVAACRLLQRPGAYLAYCAHPLYGSYEHEAYALGFEPAAIQAMQQADILILGNSRVQFAFSTPQTDRFFQERAIRYHLLGFGYGESSKFPRTLLERYRPTPKVVIINADPFFNPVLSPAAYQMFQGRWAAYADAALKKAFGALHASICQVTPFCRETEQASYRDRRTGQWIWHDVLLPRATTVAAITPAKVNAWSPDSVAGWQRDAETFLALLPLPRECVILTGVPTIQVDSEGMASALGQRLGTPVVTPDVPGLRTVDDSHLSADSAERWSASFLDAASARIEACLAASPRS